MKLFSFQGRVGRRTYFVVAAMTYLVNSPLETVLQTCAPTFGRPGHRDLLFWPALSRLVQPYTKSENAALAVMCASLLAMLTVAVVAVAFGVRRLRDSNLAAWYVLTPLLVPALLPHSAQGDNVSLAIEVLCDILLIALPATDRAWRVGPIISESARQKPVEVF